MLDMLNATLLTVAEESINTLLRQDSVTLQRLAKLNGRIIEVVMTEPSFNLFIIPSDQGLQIHQGLSELADVTLTGTSTNFISLLTQQDKANAMFGNGVQISGNNGIATEFQSILMDTQIDWEAMLAKVVGQLPAHQLGNLFRFKSSQYQTAGNSLLTNLEEYIREESELLAPKPAVSQFFKEIDKLRLDTDRLEARFQRLQARINNDD